MYAEYRFAGPLKERWDGTTWNFRVGHLFAFSKWARAEGFAQLVPFAYRMGKRFADGVLVVVERHLARVRGPRPHPSIKYVEHDFCGLFVRALAGLEPDGCALLVRSCDGLAGGGGCAGQYVSCAGRFPVTR
ncbi:hypothetical protein [Streptomyces sp. NPDC093589]|uniref:hypothetical protein n=1 Tax=Streptomyces sp. NPDC093589 TaxID=3366043 RepID=UPI00382A08EC